MLDYNKMDEVLKNLDVSAKNLKSTSQVHEKLEKAEKDLKEVLGELQKEREGLQASVDIMDEFGQDHKILREKVENVLADYKLLKAGYDFLEMELKKTNSNLEELDDKFEDMKTSFKLIEKGLEEVNGICKDNGLLLNDSKKEQEDNFKDIKTTLKHIENDLAEVNGVCKDNGLLLDNLKKEQEDKFKEVKSTLKHIENDLAEVNGVCRRNGLLLNNIKTEQEDAKAKNKTLKSLVITGMLFAFGCLVMSVVGILI